jgi:glycosyltransferase involved in cell wall biosynthesis
VSGPRVLVVIQNMGYAYDRRVQNEAQALLAAGIGVTVVCPKARPDEPDVHEVDGVLVRSYPELGVTSGVLSYVREFVLAWLLTARLTWRAHRAEGFDVLQACNPPDTYWALALLWRLAGKRFVFDQHDLNPEVFEDRFGRTGVRDRVLHRLLLLLERASYATADHVVVPNESYREVATTRGRVPRLRTTVVMSTPDHRTMRRTEPRPGARGGAAHLVAYVGIMGPQDGVDRLLRAARVLEDRGRSDVRFVLMGYGDCLEALRQQSHELGLDDVVTFTGRVGQDEVRAWLSSADLGVTPDPLTPFTDRSTMNKTLEYMACELPTVATDLRETRRSAGDAAVYVRTEEDMATAIADLLDDPERRARMGAVGRARICGELAWDGFARAYVAAVREVLAR